MLAGLVGTAAQAGQVACTPSTGYTNCTRITYSGADQTFTVPANITSVYIKAWGGGGGGSNQAYYANQYGGGGGGFAEGTLAVTGGSSLGVRVGGGGRIDDTVGVYGGGGAGGTGQATANGGSGGGLSGVFVGTYTQANARVIAGGGGGSSPGGDVGTPGGGGGGGGGLNGGTLGGAASGQGGTAAAGGAAATGGGCNLSAPTAGSALQGGTGGSTNTNQIEGGGGGGGGYFGGGGGRCQGTQTNGMGGGGSGRLNGVTGGTGTTGANASANGTGGAAANTADSVYSAGIGAGGGYGAGGNGEVVIQWVSPRVQITKTTLAGTTGSNNFPFTHTGLKTLAGATADNSTVSVTAAATVAGVNYVGAAGVAQTITETPPSGFRTNSIQCVDANSAATGNTNPVASSVTVGTSTITIPAAAMDAGATPALSAAITCTFTNEQVLPPTLSKTFSPATILQGDTSVLTITLANTVSTAATLSAALTDTLPAGVTVAATPGASTTCTGSGAVVAVAGAGSVSLPATRTIPAGTPGGAAGSCTVTVNVTSNTAGTVTNTLAAGALQTNYGNNAAAASANLTVTSVILGLVKSAPSPALQVGNNSAYTLTVTNTGTAATTTARVVDQLPANMTYVSGTGTGWTCSAASGLVTCNYSGNIAAGGGTSAITITATPTSTASVTNYAAVDPKGGTATPTSTTCTAANTPTAGCAAPVTSTPTSVILGLVKSAPSPALQVFSNSAYTLTVTNSGTAASATARVVDQLPANLSYVSGVGTGWSCSAAGGGGALVTCNYSGSIAAGGGTSAVVITVTATSNAATTNYASVDPTGGTAPPTPTSCTAANTPSAGCAVPVTSTAGRLIAGTVYADVNHNGNLDAGESGIGGASALFVKLVPLSGGICTGPAVAAAPVTLSTGAYSQSSVAQGSYCLIVNGNSTLSDITAAYPAGWIGTQNSSGVIQLAVGDAPPAPQNFGLYSGSTLSGNVFADNGAGGGTANNGVKAG
ncbi:conserved repeat domain-containing protein, partial [Polaromonas sp. JS666]